MPGCSTGRNIQKYKGGGASTLQDALENGNTASLDVVLQSPAVFIGDGGGLSNINASSTTGNLQSVTNNGATSTTKITLTNSATSLETTGNIVASTNIYATEFYGDGGTLSNIAANKNFQDVTTLGNTSSLTISFTNPAESITTTGNVIVGTNVHATDFVGGGAGLTNLHADNIDNGQLAIARGGTGVSSLNNLIQMGTHTTGDYVSTITGGNGITSTGTTSGENIAHTLSIDLKTNSGLEFDTNKLTVDLKNDGGIVLEGNELAVKLDASSITGKLAVADGGTGSDTLNNLITLGTHTTGNYVGAITAGDGISAVTMNSEGGTPHIEVDEKANGGLVFESNKLAVDLSASDITGKLAVADGGSNNDSFTGSGVLYYDSSNAKFVSTAAGTNGQVLKVISGVPGWGSDNVGGSSSVGTLSQVTANGANTNDKITLSNTEVSLETSGNVVVGNNKFFKGDAGLLSNIASGSVTINTSSTSSENDIIFTTGSNNLDKDANGRIKYNPDTNILTIKDASNQSNTLNSLSWSGNAASADKLSSSVKIGNVDFDGSNNIIPNAIQLSDSSDNNDFLVPFSNVTSNGTIKLHSDAGIFTYNPDSGTLKSNHFHGDGSNLTDISTGNLDGSVPIGNGGTGRNSIANDSLLLGPSNTSDTSMKVLPPDTSGTKYLQSTNGGVSWQTVTATISISGETNADYNRGVIFANGNNLLEDQSNFFYNSKTGTLQTSNIVTSGTGDSARNGISNTNSNHTLSIGEKIICEETNSTAKGIDTLRINGNVLAVNYILGSGRYLSDFSVMKDQNDQDVFEANDGAPNRTDRLGRFNM
tara:strand:- start:5127 stop:7589 length:2463 start_codon:yes stop_codon:yes gene_type:complete